MHRASVVEKVEPEEHEEPNRNQTEKKMTARPPRTRVEPECDGDDYVETWKTVSKGPGFMWRWADRPLTNEDDALEPVRLAVCDDVAHGMYYVSWLA